MEEEESRAQEDESWPALSLSLISSAKIKKARKKKSHVLNRANLIFRSSSRTLTINTNQPIDRPTDPEENITLHYLKSQSSPVSAAAAASGRREIFHCLLFYLSTLFSTLHFFFFKEKIQSFIRKPIILWVKKRQTTLAQSSHLVKDCFLFVCYDKSRWPSLQSVAPHPSWA